MNELEPIDPALARALAAAAEPEVPAGLEDRLLPGLRGAWGAEAVLPPSVPGAGSMAAGTSAPLFGTLGAFTTAAALVVGGVAGATLHAVLATPPAPPVPVVVAPAQVTPLPPVPAAAAPEPSPASTADAPRAPNKPPPVASRPSTLQAEQRALDAARTALLRGEPTLALPLLEKYAREHPHGAMAEEHAALWVQALARVGRADEAQAAGAAFHRQFPESLLGDVVDLALRQPPPDSGR